MQTVQKHAYKRTLASGWPRAIEDDPDIGNRGEVCHRRDISTPPLGGY
jgi:hypothetical protein